MCRGVQYSKVCMNYDNYNNNYDNLAKCAVMNYNNYDIYNKYNNYNIAKCSIMNYASTWITPISVSFVRSTLPMHCNFHWNAKTKIECLKN